MKKALGWKRFVSLLAALMLALAQPVHVQAHDGIPHSPQEVWQYWNLDPFLLIVLLLTAYLYFSGVLRLWQRAGRGKGIAIWQPLAYGAGLLLLFTALISPLDALAHALFSAHMIQHVILMMFAALLIAFSNPGLAIAWAMPKRVSQAFMNGWRKVPGVSWSWKIITQPLVVWFIYAIVSTAWHHPLLYKAALDRAWIHQLEHSMFFGAALLFWWKIAHSGRPGEMSYGQAVFFVFTAAMFGGAFAAIMTFSSVIWYSFYPDPSVFWGLTRLEDQQMAGMIMWVPGKIVHLLVIVGLAVRWFRSMDRGRATKATSVPASEQSKDYLPIEEVSGWRQAG
jgi:putative membrane protein